MKVDSKKHPNAFNGTKKYRSDRMRVFNPKNAELLIQRYGIVEKNKFRVVCKEILARCKYDTLIIDIYLPGTILGYLFPCFASIGVHLGKLVSVAKLKSEAGDKKHS